MPAQGTALGIGSGVENSNALKGQNRFVVKDPQGVALGFPVSAPSGQQKSATPKLAEGGWGGSGAGWRVPCCRAIKTPLYPPFAKGGRGFRRRTAQQFQDEWKPKATSTFHHPTAILRRLSISAVLGWYG
jgi:hypothetical protein